METHGAINFCDLWHNGERLQVVWNQGEVPWRVEDLIEVSGEMRATRAGEMSLWVQSWRLIARPTRPLAQEADEGRTPEQRFLLDGDRWMILRQRSRMTQAIRQHLWGEGFEETSTPCLHEDACGAAARPFETHLRARDETVRLRLAPEAHLMRLLMSGADRIFEIGPCFRNEGISDRHQPQFELLETYCVGEPLNAVMDRCWALVSAARQGAGAMDQTSWRGSIIDWTSARRVELHAVVQEVTGLMDEESCLRRLEELGVDVSCVPSGWAWTEVFSREVEPHLIAPTFVTGWPVCVSPLAGERTDEPGWTDRFELYVGGMEIANGYVQERRLEEQVHRFAGQAQQQHLGDVMQGDRAYLFAMGWGMPEISGYGLGLDRLAQLLLEQERIQDVVTFYL